MNGRDLQTILEGLLESLSEQHVCDDDCREGGCDRDVTDDWKDEFDGSGTLAGCTVTTFEAGGYLTRDAGLVVQLADGSEFQITIVQSRYAAAERE